MDLNQLWQAALGELELNLSKANFTTWFKNTKIINYDKRKHEATLSVPNIFTKEWLQNKYHKFILSALKNVAPEIKKINYQVGEETKTNLNNFFTTSLKKVFVKKEEKTEEPNRLVFDPETNLNPKYTFKSFIVGSNNELAHAACQAVVKNPGTTYNPLFIYGGVGLGKTHLLQATGNEIAASNPLKKIKYLSSEKFTSEMIKAIQNHKTNGFKDYYRNVDVLIVDDVQFLAGKEKTQEEFFHTFNALYTLNKQIILSSDRPPKAIPTLEERLRSRFEGGMIADIGQPDLETRMAILRAKCKEKGFSAPREVLNYIASQIQNNIRELEGALNRVVAYCELNNTRPTLENTTTILASLIKPVPKKTVNAKQIIDAVSSFYNLSRDEILGKSRKKELVKPRQISMYLLREEVKSSYPYIGEVLGGRDHTTAIHACKKIEAEINNDDSLKQEINLIKKKIFFSG